MTARTGKDEAEAVPDTQQEPAAAEETAAAEEPPARPAKRRRRVRVIEVIDDEDLDEVLEALDAEDEEPPAPARKPLPARKPAAAPKPRPVPAKDEPAERRPGLLGLGPAQAAAVAVVVALLASVAIWQWRSASGLSSEQADRDAVEKVARAYGDVAFNYNAANYRSQSAKAEALMAGDLLESFKGDTVASLAGAFKTDPQVGLTSRTDQVFVGGVDGRFATAVVMVDVGYKTKDGSVSSPSTLLRLALAKIGGKWKITRQYPSGVNDQNRDQEGRLPAVPSATPKTGKTGD
ncbi:hypothetical protein AGRA3207_002529 [Actinomadura graeca]|uniref:Mce-associated membrane protein n=1 Tax=Actinomadura graeca TaxID=2750812 RepID=A0ABX8QUK6_9ACTN|nr:hypothetical protein [Actinomadura graeca]QXJ21654.1 hypothetical protein AGRA3207_002529 [Actinomadura graeca]